MMTASGEVIIRLNSTAGCADLDRLDLGLAEPESDRDEVAADLPVDGEQGGQGVLHRQRPCRDLRAHQDTDDLGDRRARPEEGRQERQCHDETDDDQAERVAAQRREQACRSTRRCRCR